jgi:Rubisco LSMT substrate-binding
MIDMANHQSTANAEVAFEFFGNSYSLALSYAPSSDTSNKQQQLYISYGPRSNDQLLQYYGFIERDNPHDVYIMPPLRSWDIGALETALGRPFAPGRLEKLDRAGLLGRNSNAKDDTEDDGSSEEVLNSSGGVVLNRVQGMDPAVLQALRALVATDAEWNAAGQAIGSFAEENSGGLTNEQNARLLARTAVAMELASKATTIEQDEEMLRRMESIKSLDRMTPSERLAIQFRLEKKKLLRETIECLK